MGRFIVKQPQSRPIDKKIFYLGRQSNMGLSQKPQKNKEEVKEEISMMDTKQKVALATAVLENEAPKTKVRRIKKDLGLIERADKASNIVLTEDNKELLHD